MQFITEEVIANFFEDHDYDLRKSKYGRWIDQKCTPDVLCFIADCILNCQKAVDGNCFITKDVWMNNYTIHQVQTVFKKPSPDCEKARNEYDKFFQQPMNLLAYSGVLGLRKVGRNNLYKIWHRDILEYISMREQNSLIFLFHYISKVLTDSGVMCWFRYFMNDQTNESFSSLKNEFNSFTKKNTKIRNDKEIGRIFTKVLNPLSFFGNKRGTIQGAMSKDVITKDELMYNRYNFRDIYSDKPKGVTRKEYEEHERRVGHESNPAYINYLATKAKRLLRQYNDSFRNKLTEHIEDGHIRDEATHIHHIFPEASYPLISFYVENLIALTPTQHLNYAHPNGRTNEINEQYQQLLLLSKADRIRENLEDSNVEHIYNFADLVYVLSIGFNCENRLEIEEMDFECVVHMINDYYFSRLPH